MAVADCGSFSAAARALHLSQSAVSRQVAELERQFDCTLLRRTGRGVELTGPGGRFLIEARRILHDLAVAADALRHPQPRGLRLAAVSGPLAYWLPDVLACFAAECHVRLEVLDAQPDEIVSGLSAGRLDVGICNLPIKPGIKATALLDEPMMAVVPRLHALAGREVIRLEDLRSESFILPPAGQPLHMSTVGACRAEGWQPQIGFLVGSSQLCCELVAAGLGVSVVPSMCALRNAHRVSCLRLVPSWHRTLGAVYLEETPLLGRFLRVLKASVPAL